MRTAYRSGTRWLPERVASGGLSAEAAEALANIMRQGIQENRGESDSSIRPFGHSLTNFG